MSKGPKVLCFAGSLRKDSLNKKLVKVAMTAAEEAGAEVTYVDLKEFPMPLYDEEIEKESGLPENAKKLKAIMKEHQAFLIASPEYNSSISGVLKNTIDWTSRPSDGDKSLECYTGKVAGIMAASPGALGGLRGLVALRSILGNIGVIVLPEQHAVSQAHELFTPEGALKDEKHKRQITNIGKRVTLISKAVSEAELVAKA